MGGSNNPDNLWPQHVTVFERTDPVEPLLCQLMSEGKMRQSEAIETILEVKQHPETAARVAEDLVSRANRPR